MSKKLKIFRIRKYCGYEGRSNYYYHADIISSHWQSALKAAQDDRVLNWRWIDKFDIASKTYKYFEYLYMVNGSENAQKPLPKGTSVRKWWAKKLEKRKSKRKYG